jgi:glycosyltransferase involved in cell wall biosynthesis
MVYTPRLEPFGYAPLEANACGTAVVALAEGGVRETVVEGVNGTLVHRCDPDALARPIERLVSDLGLAADFGRSARQHVEQNWGLDRSIDRIESRIMAAAGHASAVRLEAP